MLFLGGNEHSVKVSSNSEMVRAGVLFENFGDYRELILNGKMYPFFNLLSSSDFPFFFTYKTEFFCSKTIPKI